MYSLACVVFEAVDGKPPFERSSDIATLLAHVQAPIPTLTSGRPGIEAMEGVFAIGLAKDRADRFPTAGAFMVALDGATEARSATPRAVIRTDRAPIPPAIAAALSPLIGRERDIAAIERTLETGVRLLTVSGPGGSGKTRLALELFGRSRADGVDATFVDLVGIGDAGLVPAQIAMALGVTETADEDAAAAVESALNGKRSLLVLDNLEELLEARTFLAHLLATVPGLQVLVTSRIPLGVPGETEFPLAPLDLPAAETLADVEASPAGSLFLARARALGRLADVDEPTARAIADLCRRLDGLPLAIELAAARTRILPPASILRNLESHRAGLLANPGDGDARHGSLDAVIGWSLDLLEDNEAHVLGAVAICPGGFDIAIAEALAPDRDVLHAIDVLATHGLLVQRAEVEGEPWFHLLETIRAAALDRVSADLVVDRWGRLAAHIAERVGGTLEAYYRMDQAVFRRLDVLLDDVRAVLDQTEPSGAALRLEIAARFYPYWRIRTQSREGRERLRVAIAAHPEDSSDLAKAWLGVAQMERQLGGDDEIRLAATEAARIARRVDDVEVEIGALAIVGELSTWQDEAAVDRVSALLPRTDHPVVRYFGRMQLAGPGFDALDIEARIARLREAETELAGSPYRLPQGMAEANLALICLNGGRIDDAYELATRALLTLIDAGPELLAWLLAIRAAAASASSRDAEARTSLRSALELAAPYGPRVLADVLPTAVVILARSGAQLLAVRVWGAMSNQALAGALSEQEREDVLQLIDPVRASDAAAFDEAFKEGRDADASEVIAEVIAYLDASQG